MKRSLLAGLLLTMATSGCVSMPHDPHAQTTSKLTPISAPLPPGPITADQVDAANAHRAADAVWDEMDRDLQREQTLTRSAGNK
jgi:hypothetical protein